ERIPVRQAVVLGDRVSELHGLYSGGLGLEKDPILVPRGDDRGVCVPVAARRQAVGGRAQVATLKENDIAGPEDVARLVDRDARRNLGLDPLEAGSRPTHATE